MYANLQQIIENTAKQPTIVNEASKYVVVTYWWGRGNLNQNTARPCIFFYENMIKTAIKKMVNYIDYATKEIKTTSTETGPQLDNLLNVTIHKIVNGKYNSPDFQKFIQKKTTDYLGMIYEYCKLDPKDPDLDNKSMIYLEKLKQTNQTPSTYEYKDKDYVGKMFLKIINQVFVICLQEIITVYKLDNKIADLKASFLKLKTEQTEKLSLEQTASFKEQIKQFEAENIAVFASINQKLRTKQTIDTRTDPDFNKFTGMSIFDILNSEFRYLNPVTFEIMIDKWEKECTKFNCNYLSIEYPEFARPGGYQMAINAKPLFINKALSLCGNRGVLYIDGDMFIRKYPTIFDTPDVDFMARGWWIDPRSSYKMDESIMYDPYTFETSGGTMFFSQSYESKKLITMWVNESSKPSNLGKADDRILSLIFNTKTLLCNMKIIQLPIEYLWLSLDYDDRLGSEIYDYNMAEMAQTIFIEHPECLTSEDTAAGAGASNNRTPKFYNFLEELTPASEDFHEYLFFSDEKSTEAFADYLKYMDEKQYINDGNKDLLDLGYVTPDNPANNEQPMYVIRYNDKYGSKLHFKPDDLAPGEENYNANQIAEINENRAKNMNLTGFSIIDKGNNCVELNKIEDIPDKILISLLIRLLNDGKTIIYNPTQKPNYNPLLYQKIIDNKDTLFKSLEFVFTPTIDSFKRSNYFKPFIDSNQPMLLRPCFMLINYLKMFLSFNEMSSYIHNGSYEFISRTRIGYSFNRGAKRPELPQGEQAITGGGTDDVNQFMDDYDSGLNDMYGAGKKSSKTRKLYRRKNNRRKMGHTSLKRKKTGVKNYSHKNSNNRTTRSRHK